MPPHSGAVCPEIDPARFFFDLEPARSDHRDRSLCRQAMEALQLALSDATGEARLDGAWVAAVDPAPSARRLLVSVVAPQATIASDAEAALEALVEMKPWLRAEVARAVHRKRVPDLAFRIVLEGEVQHG
jgi:ribosome-binding factor A